MKVVCLLSGGMDSTTLLARLKGTGNEIVAVSFSYGQKHKRELGCARHIAEDHFDVPYYIVEVPNIFKGSALTDSGIALPVNRNLDTVSGEEPAPSYVPARNSVFLSLGAAIADAMNFEAVAYAAHAEDHMGYPDCRPEFFMAMSNALALGTKNAITVYAPFISIHKWNIVTTAAYYRAPLQLTHSCYQGVSPACGVCDTCQIRIEAFKRAGYIDPIEYAIDIDWGRAQKWPQ